MIDTLMALWNQDRRKRAGQVILTFFLMCISISLLFVLTNRSIQFQHQNRQAVVSTVNPTVPSFGNTVVPDLTPTMSVVVGTQPTPTQPTPVPTTESPCSTTPSGATSHVAALYADMLQGLTPTPTPTITATAVSTATPGVPRKPNDGGGGGGGSIPVVTPTFSAPTTPTPVQNNVTPTPGTKRGGGGWVSNCTTSNSISNATGDDVLVTLAHNLWLILGSSLLGTMLFYGTLFMVRRRMQG